jgi:hypothetical protein
VTLDSNPCSPWPNSWNSVRASSKLSSVGSPGAPFAKLLLLTTIAVTSPPERDWMRYELIHAPLRLLGRAKLSCRKMPISVSPAPRTS